MKKNGNLIKIVLTGGSCGGKTSSLIYLKKALEKKGYFVLPISETGTELSQKGITPEKLGRKEFEKRILKWQIEKEKIYSTYASKDERTTILICDRGTMDAKAYTTLEMFNSIIKELDVSEEELYNSYDAIFHMVSTAVDAPQYFEMTSNLERRENLEQSIDIDKKLREIWSEHPYFRVIDNSTDYKGKICRLLEEISIFLEKEKLIDYESMK